MGRNRARTVPSRSGKPASAATVGATYVPSEVDPRHSYGAADIIGRRVVRSTSPYRLENASQAFRVAPRARRQEPGESRFGVRAGTIQHFGAVALFFGMSSLAVRPLRLLVHLAR